MIAEIVLKSRVKGSSQQANKALAGDHDDNMPWWCQSYWDHICFKCPAAVIDNTPKAATLRVDISTLTSVLAAEIENYGAMLHNAQLAYQAPVLFQLQPTSRSAASTEL
ncbi:hypothetical protein H9L39_12921 [Fusarium oxysporum f. sp. albedinis]|nr:hypothetical protein H9L39_12921 [Fusarium oxysporum f. sp. albedinis]